MSSVFWRENGPKLHIRETFAAASKRKWLCILRTSEISSKLWLKWVNNGFSLNLDMPRPFTPRKMELQPIRLPNGLLYPRVEAKQRTHSGDEIAPSCCNVTLQYEIQKLTNDTLSERSFLECS